MDNFMCDEILKEIDQAICEEEKKSSQGTQSNENNPINLRIYLLAPRVSSYVGIMSQIILDSWGDYYLQYRATSLDGVNAPSLFNNHGYTEIMSSYEDSREISFVLYKGFDKAYYFETRNPERENTDLVCCDTPVGFKLSQIIKNIGDIDQIALDQGNALISEDDGFGQGPIQVLLFNQKGYISEKDGERRLIFKFQITNVSPVFAARRVLFKDILPKGVSLIPGEVYINGKKVEDFKVCKDGRRVFVRLPVINPTDQVVLSLVCSLYKNKEGLTNYKIMNFGALCSVYSNYISNSSNAHVIKAAVQISNIVFLRDIM